MKLLYIADGRSQTAINWISYFIRRGHEVHLASTYPCQPITGLASIATIPVAMSGSYGAPEMEEAQKVRTLRKLLPVTLRTQIRQLVAPFSFPHASNLLCRMIDRVRPELIHAMRIPFEGMIASLALKRAATQGGYKGKIPLLVSVWGNDFTLHARSTPVMAYYTRQTLQHIDAIHTDCQRDLRLAGDLGFSFTKPRIVIPGGGGIKLDIFYPSEDVPDGDEKLSRADKQRVTIINPRGIRAYVRNDTFFHAIPLVLKMSPSIRFVCPGMEGEAQAQKWISDLGIGGKVELLAAQSREGMAELFRQSQISLSITTHDGTPNTLLEAMACGCFPIAGDIESLREWIDPGVNGLLVNPDDPKELAKAILAAISQPDVRRQARERNIQLVKERGEYRKTMNLAEDFYNSLVLDQSLDV